MKGASAPGGVGTLGLYLLIAYCGLQLCLAFLALPLPDRVFIGPFLLSGRSAHVVMVITALAWVVMLLGLVIRRAWGRALGLGVFAIHTILSLLAITRWVSDPDGAVAAYREYAGPGGYIVTPHDAFYIMVRPILLLLIPSVLALIFLIKSRNVFLPARAEGVV